MINSKLEQMTISEIKPDLKEFKKSKSPFGKLIDFYINLRHGPSRHNYLKKESKTLKQEKLNLSTTRGYFFGLHPFPLKYLKGFADELQIPLEELIEVNNGKNPFEPDLERFKKSKSPFGKLIDFYINLRHNPYREDYLRKESNVIKQEKLNACTAEGYILGNIQFPLKYLKGFVDELQIPLEEIVEVNDNKNPFKPDLKKYKKARCSVGKLIDFYINLRHGTSRDDYLKKESKTLKQEKLNVRTTKGYLNGNNPFPLKYLKGFVDELQIPFEEIVEVNGRDPFVPDLEKFKKSKNPIGKLIDFYINLGHGLGRKSYLRKESSIINQEKLNVGTALCYFGGKDPFPFNYVKAFADELKIPYSEVNYLIDGDIEKGIAKSGNVRIEPGTELILDSVKYYIKQYQKGNKERPSVFYPKPHPEFEKGHGISTKQIYRSLNK